MFGQTSDIFSAFRLRAKGDMNSNFALLLHSKNSKLVRLLKALSSILVSSLMNDM